MNDEFARAHALFDQSSEACRQCDFASEGVWWGQGRCTLGQMKYDHLLDCPILTLTFFTEE